MTSDFKAEPETCLRRSKRDPNRGLTEIPFDTRRHADEKRRATCSYVGQRGGRRVRGTGPLKAAAVRLPHFQRVTRRSSDATGGSMGFNETMMETRPSRESSLGLPPPPPPSLSVPPFFLNAPHFLLAAREPRDPETTSSDIEVKVEPRFCPELSSLYNRKFDNRFLLMGYQRKERSDEWELNWKILPVILTAVKPLMLSVLYGCLSWEHYGTKAGTETETSGLHGTRKERIIL